MNNEIIIIWPVKVRWIEAAIVSPAWTSMMVYYVEGDSGHLMTEEVGKQRFRTVVRGSCCSYQMPWEDILESLQRNCTDRNITEIPRPEECLKYLLRVHLNVNGLDFKKHLKQVHVRPFVLIALLDFLIDRNHEVFRGKGSAEELRIRMRTTVAREYPETESNVPDNDKTGHIPQSVLEVLQENKGSTGLSAATGEYECKKRRMVNEKNATPGDGARTLDNCLEDLRPHAICLDKNVKACSDPATLREGALERYGELHVNTGRKEQCQFHSKYTSQVLPFVVPRMVSGPDYYPDRRWRRPNEAPIVTPREFTAGFARRAEAQCRTSWDALPIVRSVAYKFAAEHTMSTVVPFFGKKNAALNTSASEYVKARPGEVSCFRSHENNGKDMV